MFFSVDTNVITRAACYCQIPGLGECIGANKRAQLCYDALQKVMKDAPDKTLHIISSVVLSECREHMNSIIQDNFEDFITQPEKRDKLEHLQEKQKNYDVMSFYKNSCEYKLRNLKNQFVKIQNEGKHPFAQIKRNIQKAIQQVLDDHNSPKETQKWLKIHAATIKATSEMFRQSALIAIRSSMRIYAQIYHHKNKPISPSDLHMLADISFFLTGIRTLHKPVCTILTMDKHLSPVLDRDGKTILSDPITKMFETLFNLACIHPWHYLHPTS